MGRLAFPCPRSGAARRAAWRRKIRPGGARRCNPRRVTARRQAGRTPGPLTSEARTPSSLTPPRPGAFTKCSLFQGSGHRGNQLGSVGRCATALLAHRPTTEPAIGPGPSWPGSAGSVPVTAPEVGTGTSGAIARDVLMRARCDGSQPVRRRASCRFADRGMGLGTHPRLTGCAGSATLAMFANGAAAGTAGRTTGDQEGHRVAAAAPPGCEWTVSVALHSWAVLLRAALGYEGPERNHRPLAPGSRSGGVCLCVCNADTVAGVPSEVGGGVWCPEERRRKRPRPPPPRPGRLRTRP